LDPGQKVSEGRSPKRTQYKNKKQQEMLKIFTIKFESNIESFNDSILTNFLGDKKVLKWEGYFFERKDDQYWTIILEYAGVSDSPALSYAKKGVKRDERYKELLNETDWPIFNRLREWRAEQSKKEGVPPYIIFTNIQLAHIAVTRPESLNALQEIEGVGNSKREKYGLELVHLIKTFGLPLASGNRGETSG
jgi:superfamily II DNA helicase RecQ